jgi:tetratricopeptide (TPR) repeat protein
MLHKALLLGAVLLAAALVQPADAQLKTLMKKDGSEVRVVILEDDGTTLKVRQGTKRFEIAYADLALPSVYMLKAEKTPAKDGKAQLALADWALEMGLFQSAREHYFKAVDADAELKEKAIAGYRRADQAQCKALLALAKQAHEKKDVQMEEKVLSHLMTTFPGSPEAAEADKMLEALQLRGETKSVIDRLDKDAQKVAERAKDHYERAVEANKRGLRNTRRQSQAAPRFESALRHLKTCVTLVKRIEKEYQQDVKVQERIKTVYGMIQDTEIQVLLNLAHVYTTRQNFIKAQGYVNQALAIDPKNKDARAARNRIELAAASDRRGWR